MLRFTEVVRPVKVSISEAIRPAKTNNENHEWFEGNPKPLFGGACVEVYATEGELQYIRNNFDNLPFPAGASKVVWKGDFAQFIYDNLRDESKKINSFSIESEAPHSQQKAG